MDDNRPLVLDVDGTFLKTDLLFETFWAGLGQAPMATFQTTLKNFTHPARLKAELAALTKIRTDLMPVNTDVADAAMEAMRDGREVTLASASNEVLVKKLARDYGLSKRVFASSATKNMKGATKARALVAAYGEAGFDYAGDAPVDQAIWAHSHTALVVGCGSAVKSLVQSGKPVHRFSGGWKFGDLMRGLRPHQWVKNILLFVPMIAAHDFTLASLLLVLLGIVSFSTAASSIYIINDLLDLEADRLHVKKKHRPFASGAVPIRIGMLASFVLGGIALSVGAWLGPAFFGIIALYMTLSLAYSLRLKRLRWIDITTLGGLYTIRVMAGAAAILGGISGFLLVFVFPVFLALACVKRLTELTLADHDECLPGRGYGRPDRGDLLNVAYIGMFGALLSFFLYSFTDIATGLYPTKWLLWVALIPIALWLRRMIRLGYTGKQDYDPMVFALKDKHGIGLMLIALAILFMASGLWQEWLGARL